MKISERLEQLRNNSPHYSEDIIGAIQISMPRFYEYWKLESVPRIIMEAEKVLGWWLLPYERNWYLDNRSNAKDNYFRAFITLIEERGTVQDKFFKILRAEETLLRDKTPIWDKRAIERILEKDEEGEIFRGLVKKPKKPIAGQMYLNTESKEISLFDGNG